MRRLKVIEWLVLLTIAIGAGPATAAFWQWSTTAASNATADPSINWAEGMSPSSVNDSARAMMAVLARWRNDISAVNTTSGTSTAYTLTTSEGVSSPPSNGQMIAFLVNVTNGASPTLAVDGGTAYPLWIDGVAAGAASLIPGTPYRVAFSNANSAWMIEAGPANPYSVPLGGIMWSTLSVAPNSSFIIPYGQCISTTTYATYWAAMGSPAPGACAAGQFAVIDMRGRYAAALDTLPGSTAANRLTASGAGCGTAMTSVGTTCSLGTEGKTLAASQIPAITSTVSVSGSISGSTSSVGIITGALSTPGGAFGFNSVSGGSASVSGTFSGSGSATSNNTGGGAHSIVPPTIGLVPMLRVL